MGDTLGKWNLVEFIAKGGNGDVWRAEANGEIAAVKILHRTGARDYARFRREVEICERRDPSELAILPVLDSYLPDSPTKRDRPWFAMPFAETVIEALAGATLTDKVAVVRDVARTLARLLTEEGVNHRDVKPENLYMFDGRPVVGDFGLAKRPDDPNLTETGDVPGPFFHLPSEAFLESEPDWERVDVYCLANSLWRLALERPYPPRGQIRADEEDSLALLLAAEPYISRLASMIEIATARSPAARPTLAMFAEQLDLWLGDRETLDDFVVEYERGETRNLAVLRWLIGWVRREPAFDRARYDIDDPGAPSDVPGLSEGDVRDALAELIEGYAIEGEPHIYMGSREPKRFTHLYPTRHGVAEIEDVEVLTAQAAPVLRAFLTPVDVLTLPVSSEPFDLREGLTLSPPEAFFQMRLLQQQSLLSFRQSGEHLTFLDVQTTRRGKEWLYQSARGSSR